MLQGQNGEAPKKRAPLQITHKVIVPEKKKKIVASKPRAIKKELNPPPKKNPKKKALEKLASQLSTLPVVEVPSLDWKETSYEELISEHLQNYLVLPSLGYVTLSLQIDGGGKVSQVKVLKASSENLKSYVQKTVPRLCFPAPKDGLSTQVQLNLYCAKRA